MTVSGFTMTGRSANWIKPWRARPKRVGRKIATACDGFGARAAAQEADGGVTGSRRAERPKFEGSREGRRAGKRGVPTFHCTLSRPAASSTLSMRTDFLVGTVSGCRKVTFSESYRTFALLRTTSEKATRHLGSLRMSRELACNCSLLCLSQLTERYMSLFQEGCSLSKRKTSDVEFSAVDSKICDGCGWFPPDCTQPRRGRGRLTFRGCRLPRGL